MTNKEMLIKALNNEFDEQKNKEIITQYLDCPKGVCKDDHGCYICISKWLGEKHD